jgi:ribosome maturation factor RimP
MENAEINERLRAIAEQAANEKGTEFVHSEVSGTKRNMVLRIYIDKPGGVTIDDCSNVSRAIEDILDIEDFIHSSYVLEVSSPGLERELYSLSDFEKFLGQKAKVKTSLEIDSQRNFVGKIAGVENGEVVLEDRTSGTVRIPYDAITRANLRVDLGEEFKKRRA